MSQLHFESLNNPTSLIGVHEPQKTRIIQTQQVLAQTVVTGDNTQITLQQVTNTIQSVSIIDSAVQNENDNVDNVDKLHVSIESTKLKGITHADLRGCAVIAAIALLQQVDNDVFRCGLLVTALAALS